MQARGNVGTAKATQEAAGLKTMQYTTCSQGYLTLVHCDCPPALAPLGRLCRGRRCSGELLTLHVAVHVAVLVPPTVFLHLDVLCGAAVIIQQVGPIRGVELQGREQMVALAEQMCERVIRVCSHLYSH